MRWRDGRRSDNIEDRRDESPPVQLASGAPLLLRLVPMLLQTRGGRYLLLGAVVVVVGARLLGVDLLGPLESGTPGLQQAPTSQRAAPAQAL